MYTLMDLINEKWEKIERLQRISTSDAWIEENIWRIFFFKKHE